MSKLTPSDRELIDILMFNGLPLNQIAKEVGCSRQYIHKLASKARNITPEIEYLLENDREFILDRQSLDSTSGFINRNTAGASYTDIAEVLCLSAEEVKEIERSALYKAKLAFEKLGYP